MTPAQQTALEALAGRPLTAGEIAMAAIRNDGDLAASLSSGLPPKRISVPVEAVFAALYASGDYMTLKAAQMQGDPVATMAFAVLKDAKDIGPGKVDLDLPATQELLDKLADVGLLSAAGRAALDLSALADADPVTVSAVSAILNEA